jgi:Zn finger protein HypA/HybF involved in hydrogenase expression
MKTTCTICGQPATHLLIDHQQRLICPSCNERNARLRQWLRLSDLKDERDPIAMEGHYNA